MAEGREIGHRRVIVEAEAQVVRTIYADYASGMSPAKIADSLNARAIKAPRGIHWSRNAIYGDRRDLSGILNNPIYLGELVWNRSKFIQDPDTGGRVKRRNPESEWTRKSVPELRIVPEELHLEVQARMAQTADKSAAIREGIGASARNGADGKFLLTGLLRCGICGGPISTTARNVFGCSVRHNRGDRACNNDVKFNRELAETALLDAVRAELFTPHVIGRFVELLGSEFEQQSKTSQAAVVDYRKALKDCENRIEGCLEFIEAGQGSASVAGRLAVLEAKVLDLRNAIGKEDEVRSLSTAELSELRKMGLAALDSLPALLAGAVAETRVVLGRLLGAVVVTPAQDKLTLEMKMAGHMTGLLQIEAGKKRKTSSLVSVVAGTGFEPVTFGL